MNAPTKTGLKHFIVIAAIVSMYGVCFIMPGLHQEIIATIVLIITSVVKKSISKHHRDT